MEGNQGFGDTVNYQPRILLTAVYSEPQASHRLLRQSTQRAREAQDLNVVKQNKVTPRRALQSFCKLTGALCAFLLRVRRRVLGTDQDEKE
ncbi:MAG: hypothetical protein ACI8Z1_001476 [Candidatus Azotimanducaceae bacterium]|jgi:hypothetical protein